MNTGICCHCCLPTPYRSNMCFRACNCRIDCIPAKGMGPCLFAMEFDDLPLEITYFAFFFFFGFVFCCGCLGGGGVVIG